MERRASVQVLSFSVEVDGESHETGTLFDVGAPMKSEHLPYSDLLLMRMQQRTIMDKLRLPNYVPSPLSILHEVFVQDPCGYIGDSSLLTETEPLRREA
ncbi:MAG TPA: hypothetical protein VMR41_05315 [Patescibacteria group bacterium]|nr:hypothetical protein [Patescibacteria group bacterium]